MVQPAKRVLIVEHDEALCDLLIRVLADEGYDATAVIQSSATFDQVSALKPDLLLIDVMITSGGAPDMQLLDALRMDPSCAIIPVVVLSTMAERSQFAMSSYNVRENLAKPFDLDELLDKVRLALDEPPLHKDIPVDATAGGIVEQAEYILRQHSRAALLRWVQVLRQQPEWQGRQNTSMREVLQSAPAVVEALNAALHFGSPKEYFDQHPEGTERIRGHSRMRVRQGMPLTEVVREFSLLRMELWALFARYLPGQVSTADMNRLQRSVDGGLDQIVEIVVESYLEEQGQTQR